MLHARQHVIVEPERRQIVEIGSGAVQQTHDDALAIERGQRRDAKIDLAAQGLDLDTAVLRQAALGDIQLRHQLDARDHGRLHLAGRGLLVVEHAVDAVSDAKLFFERLDVNVAGALLHGLRDDGVHQADDRRFARHVAQVLEIFARPAPIQLEFGFGACADSP